jgi:hypothetical protein
MESAQGRQLDRRSSAQCTKPEKTCNRATKKLLYTEVVFHRNLSRMLNLFVAASQKPQPDSGSHRTRNAHLALAPYFGD